MHNLPDRSNDNVIDTFKAMFPDTFVKDSPMDKMTMGARKTMYVTNHGLFPYYKKVLQDRIDKSKWLSVSYDASRKEVLKKKDRWTWLCVSGMMILLELSQDIETVNF